MRSIMLVPLAAAFALSACGDSGSADTDGDGVISGEEAAAAFASSPMPMRPGEWEQSVQLTDIQIPGMSEQELQLMRSFMGNAMTVSSCMTAEDMKDPDPEMFGGDDESDCKFDQFDRRGNAIAMKMTCNSDDGGVMNMTLSGEFAAEAYAMDLETRVTGGQTDGAVMKGKLSSRRLGDCKGG